MEAKGGGFVSAWKGWLWAYEDKPFEVAGTDRALFPGTVTSSYDVHGVVCEQRSLCRLRGRVATTAGVEGTKDSFLRDSQTSDVVFPRLG